MIGGIKNVLLNMHHLRTHMAPLRGAEILDSPLPICYPSGIQKHVVHKKNNNNVTMCVIMPGGIHMCECFAFLYPSGILVSLRDTKTCCSQKNNNNVTMCYHAWWNSYV